MTKQEFVLNYVKEKISYLNSLGISVSQEQINELFNNRIDMSKDEAEIINTIDVLVESVIENFNKKQEEKQKFIEKLSEVKELQELPLQYTGITLNNQDIDLMLIATSENLEETLKQITNIKTTINPNADIESERQRIFDLYMSSLSSRVDYYADKSIQLSKKIEYLKGSGLLSSEEIAMIDKIVSASENQREMMTNLTRMYSQNPSRLHQVYETIRDYTPIEKTGIIGTSMEAYKNLYVQIQQNYNSLTIDEEGKYGPIALPDGTFNFKHLQKSLDFARDNDKQVRLNALIFYMDCPEYLYQMEKSEQSKQLVKQKLMDYVSATTKFIGENGYSDVVRSYDVFNELLNRYPMDGDVPYQYRGSINQEPSLYKDFDNVKSGWLKHLDIEDLCDVIAEARKNNLKLQELYAKGQEKAVTYETHLVTQLVGGMLSRFPEEASMDDIAYGTEQLFEQTSLSMQQEATKKDQDTVSKIETISTNDVLSNEEKSFQLERTKRTIKHTNETLAHRQSALERARQSVQYSIEMGCKTKTEVVTTVSQITEANTTKKESTKEKMQECVIRTMQMNQGQQLQYDKSKPLVKQNNNNSNNAGFTNVISLALMVTFVCGFLAGIGYMIYKITIGG